MAAGKMTSSIVSSSSSREKKKQRWGSTWLSGDSAVTLSTNAVADYTSSPSSISLCPLSSLPSDLEGQENRKRQRRVKTFGGSTDMAKDEGDRMLSVAVVVQAMARMAGACLPVGRYHLHNSEWFRDTQTATRGRA